MKKREEKKNNDWIPVFTGMTREESEVGFFSSVIPVKTGIQKKDWIPAFPPSPKAMERQSAGMTERMRGSRIIEMINKTSRKILAGVLCALKRTSFALFIFAIISVSCFGGLGKFSSNIFGVKIANAAFNKEINYQGKLTDSSGTAVSNGNYNIQFNLYTASSGGSPIWTENQCYSPDGGTTCDGTGTDSRVAFTGGLFSAMLGNISSLASVDFNQTLYLGVKIGGSGATPTWDTEMTPRKILGAVPASFESDKLDGLDATSFLRSDATNSGAIFTNSTTTNATTTNSSITNLTVTGTGTSTFAGAINLTSGCFAINGVCSSGLGTVTSVGMTTPTGLSVSGSPITGAGTLALSFASGYSIPLTASTTEGTTAYTRSVSSWTTPLQFSNGVASILQSGSATNGYLSSGDWNIFNNKISSSSLSAVYPLSYNSSTGIFTSALTTTTANTWSGLQTFSNTGTTTFAGGVEVSGHFTSGANKALVVNSTATANSLVVASNGNVGVGTASPTVVLDVAGDINVSSTKAYRIGGFATLTQSGLITRFGNSLGAGSAYQLAFYSGTGSEAMRIDSTSNVGIGTTTPGSRLSIQGIANFSLATSTVYSGIFTSGLHATSSGLTISGGNILLTSGATSTFNNGIDISSGCFSINGTCISGGAGGGGTVTSVATNNGLTGGTITGSGTIGLNITGLSANDLVTWNGTNLVATGTPQLTIGNLVATSTTATSTLLGGFTAGNNSAFVVNQTATANALTIAGNGNVGVGTTGPSDLLNVYGDNKYFALQRSVNSADMGVRFKTGLTNDWFFGLRDTVDSDFHMYNYGTNSDALTILKANGNIGIGTAVPSTALEIRHTDATTNSNTSFWDYTFGGGLILSNITNTANALTGIGLYGGVNSNSAAGLAMVQETANSLGGLAFYTGGSGRNNTVPERFRIDSGGNVGIGTTSPAKLLSVQGDGLFAGDLSLANLTATGTITSTGTGTSTFAGGLAVSGHFTSGANSALVVNSGATANSLVVTSNGNVGVGTANPGYKLDVNGDVNLSGNNLVGVGTSYISRILARTTNTDLRIGIRGDSSKINFENYGADVIATIQNNGFVGIGTTTPAKLLSVQGDGLFAGNLSLANLTATGTVTSTGTGTSTFAGGLAVTGHFTSGANSALVVNSGATANSLVVASNGNVGVGTASPLAALDIRQNTINKGIIVRPADGGSEYFELYVTNSGAGTFYSNDNLMFSSDLDTYFRAATGRTIKFADTTNANVTMVTGGGNVGIGTTSPYAKLSLVGNQAIYNRVTSNIGLDIFGIDGQTADLFRVSSTSATYATSTAFVIDANGKVGIGTTTPYTQLSVQGGIAGDFLNLSSTATSTFAGGVDIGAGSFSYDYESGVTSIASLETGNLNFDVDAGAISWVDLPLSGALAGTLESYTASIADLPAITVYGLANGSGGIYTGPFVGIGTSTPSSVLSVWGLSNGTNRMFELVNSASTTLMSMLENGTGYFAGSIGIGTTSPAKLLSVQGDGLFAGDISLANLTATGTITSTGTGTSTFAGGLAVSGHFTSGANSALVVNSGATANSLVVASNGNVGVGIMDPTSYGRMEINTPTGTNNQIYFTDNNLATTYSASSARFLSKLAGRIGQTSDVNGGLALDGFVANINNVSAVTITGYTGTSFTAPAVLVSASRPNGSSAQNLSDTQTIFGVSNSSSLKMSVMGSGFVGIGTTTPAKLLSVQGDGLFAGDISLANLTATGTITSTGTGTSTFAGGLAVSGHFTSGANSALVVNSGATANSLVVTSNGRVGIGTSDPGAYSLKIASGDMNIGGSVVVGSSLKVNNVYGGQNSGNSLTLQASVNNPQTGYVLLAPTAGNVGIGTTTPAKLLSVQGDGLFAGDLSVAGLTATGTVAFTGTGTSTFAGGLAVTGHLTSGVNKALVVNSGAIANSLVVTSNGNIGIGVANPSKLLEVVSGATTAMSLNSSGLLNINSALQINGSTAFSVSGTQLRIGTSYTSQYLPGLVGIGTTTPAKLLSVQGDGLFAGDISLANLTATGTATLGNISSGGGSTLFGINAGLTISHGPNLQTMTYGATGLNVASEVGYGNPFSSQAGGSTAWGGIFLNTSGLLPTVYLAGGASNPYSAIFLNGNVGIGTTTPGYKLVTSNATVNTFMMEESGGGTQTPPTTYALQGSGAAFSTFASDATNGYRRFLDIISDGTAGSAGSEMRFFTGPGGAVSERMRLDYNGNVGIGTTSPSTLLHLGTAGVADSNLLTLEDSNGICTMNPGSGASWSCSSDRELKHDIADLSSVGLDTINRLRPTTFKMNAGNSERVGFIAQEVREILPSLVSVLPDGHLGVSDGGMMPYVVKAIQEGYTKLLELEQKTASTTEALSARISELELHIGTTTVASVIDGASSSDLSGSTSIPSIDSILTSLEILGTKIIDGLISVRDLVAEVITVKKLTVKSDNLASTGVTIYDRETGLPVCMYVANGVVSTEAGECGSVVADTSSASPVDISTATSTPSLPAPEIITPPADSGTSTSTEPVIIPDPIPEPIPEPVSDPILTDTSTTTPSDVPDTVVVPADESSEALATTTPSA